MMNRITYTNLAAFLLAFLIIACAPKKDNGEVEEQTNTNEVTEEVQTSDETVLAGHFGAVIDETEVVDMATLIEGMEGKDSLEVKLAGEILATCAMKGCWMNLSTGTDLPMKVRFKDYAFFVPKSGVEGKQAIVEGVVKKQMVDVATLQHYAEDAGQSAEEVAAITEPKEMLTFLASGVIIK